MKKIGAYEAKTHLPSLLESVLKGNEFVITKHGIPVARLSPISETSPAEQKRAIDEILKTRSKRRLKGLSIKELIEEGRK